MVPLVTMAEPHHFDTGFTSCRYKAGDRCFAALGVDGKPTPDKSGFNWNSVGFEIVGDYLLLISEKAFLVIILFLQRLFLMALLGAIVPQAAALLHSQ